MGQGHFTFDCTAARPRSLNANNAVSRQDAVGLRDKGRRKGQRQISCRRFVESQIVAGRIADGKVTWICPLEELVNVTGGLPVLFYKIWRPRHQTSGFGEYRRLVTCRYPMLRHKVDNQLPADERQSALEVQ